MSNRVSAQLYALAGCSDGEPVADPDLLAAHLAGDPGALGAILDRHGASVWRVCRAQLAASDADDAFQATILVFLRDAGRIRDGRSLAGWLVRVAHLVCLKAHRDTRRRRLSPLATDPPGNTRDPSAVAEADDLSAAVCAELARLPSKLRAVLVLCVMEDRSNAEAARVLNVPRGTVDSRLFHAKARLKTGLARRGIVPAALLSLTPTALPGAASAAARLASALPRLTAAPPAVLTLVNGVSTTMSLVKLATATLLAAGLIGTAGWGLMRTHARDDAPPKEQAAKPAEPPAKAKQPEKSPEKPAAAPVPVPPEPVQPVLSDEASVRTTLRRPFPFENLTGLTYNDLFTRLEQGDGLVIRYDVAAIARFYPEGMTESAIVRESFLGGGNPGATKINGNIRPVGTVAEVLDDLMSGLPGKMTCRIRGNRVLITPAYIPPTRHVKEGEEQVDDAFARHYLSEQTLGPPVSASFRGRPVESVIEDLRLLTGANIVMTTSPEPNRAAVTATFDDVRLLTVLEHVADISGRSVVFLDNVYYITNEESAERLRQRRDDRTAGKLPVIPRSAGAPMG